jgi:ferredoxin
MESFENKIREISKKLLEEGKIKTIIGYAEGTLPLRTTPIFVRDINEVDKLVWNRFCSNNLANYLLRLRIKKVAIIAKACDCRSIVGFIKERQIEREDIFILGLPCEGIINAEKIERELFPEEIESFSINKDSLKVNHKTFSIREYLYDNCKVCQYPNPPLYDVLIGEKVESRNLENPYQEVDEFSSFDPQKRFNLFMEEINRCMRCYACRNSCPLCYCEECFVDQSQPSWFGKSINPSDTAFYHIIRAFHTAGRCVDCGACERACPFNIKLRYLTKKIEKEVKERFNYIPGLDLETPPPLSTFEPDDKEDFMILE